MKRRQLTILSATAILASASFVFSPLAGVVWAKPKVVASSPANGLNKTRGKGLMCPTVCETINGQTVCYTDCRPN